MLSGLGWGTNRFNPADLQNEEGIEKIADLIVDGVRQGINYIDCGHTYAMGKAEEIVALSLKKINQEALSCYTSTKVMYMEDPTERQARSRIEKSLNKMGIEKVTFGFAWRVDSYDEFTQIIRPGGLYEGLLKAQNEGLMEHICFSSHASVEDTIRMIESGCFDGCMISCNILNVHNYLQLFDVVKKCNVGLLTMNSLGGGVVTRMKELASCFPDSHETNEIASMALAELYSHKEITTCLSTMQNTRELMSNLTAFENGRLFSSQYVPQRDIKRYCTKCRYCKGCPVGIPVSDIMYAYNNLAFSDLTVGYGKYDSRSSAQLFNPRFCDYNAIPETKDNPCIRCGQCEKKCTQKLPIIRCIKNFYETASKGSYTREQRKIRLFEKIKKHEYRRICFFPAGSYTKHVIDEYLGHFGDSLAEIFIGDNKEQIWGQNIVVKGRSFCIISPKRMKELEPDLVLITNFFYGEEIYQQFMREKTFPEEVRLEKLHEDGDVPWY